MTRLPTEEEYLADTIRCAKEGDAEAGKELLQMVVVGLDQGNMPPDLAQYHADCLSDYVHRGIQLDRALNVEPEASSGGRPSWDDNEIIAVDVFLRKFANMGKEQAADWIEDNGGPRKRTVQNIRKRSNLPVIEAYDKDLLLHMAGSMRRNLAVVFAEE